jgi:hypothetical protein
MEKSWVWWCMPLIPATAGHVKQKNEVGLGKKQDPIYKIIRAKGLEAWLKSLSRSPANPKS